MLSEAFPRLAVRLRSVFPQAILQLNSKEHRLTIRFPNFPKWEIVYRTHKISDGRAQFQLFEASAFLSFESISKISNEDFAEFLATENAGLRGVTLVADPSSGRNGVRARTSFVGQKGRSRDEAESLAILAVSLLKYCQLLDDRIERSSAGDQFSLELYQSTYRQKSSLAHRYINYARHIFQGSHERVFAQVVSMLRDDYKCQVQAAGHDHSARILVPNSMLEISIRIPEMIPMLTATATFALPSPLHPTQLAKLMHKLNDKLVEGHFEIFQESTFDEPLVSFVAWKNLTNDLRYYSMDRILHHVHDAAELLRATLNSEEPMTSGLELKTKVRSDKQFSRAA